GDRPRLALDPQRLVIAQARGDAAGAIAVARDELPDALRRVHRDAHVLVRRTPDLHRPGNPRGVVWVDPHDDLRRVLRPDDRDAGLRVGPDDGVGVARAERLVVDLVLALVHAVVRPQALE